MRIKNSELGVFLHTNKYPDIFEILKTNIYYEDGGGEILYWFYIDYILEFMEDILNSNKKVEIKEKKLLEFLKENNFKVSNIKGKWRFSKKYPFEHILFYTD